MKNPLIKRLPRELKGEIGKYIVLFLFITMMIGIVSGFLVAAGSMSVAYDESFEKYNIESGNFELLQKADDDAIKKIEDGEEKIKVYENFYLDKETKEVDSTIRLFKNRKDIDRICIMDGELPSADDEIAIDRMYADNNKLKVGDSLTVGFSDYSINLGGALICGYTGVGPDAIVNRSAVKSSVRGEEVALDVLAAAQPKKLYILLGTNTLTTVGAADRFLAYYGQMLDVLRQTLGEDCVIYVESIPPVRPEAAAEKPGLASDIIRSVNEQLALLAADKGCVYLDLWETLADGEGNLKEVLAAPDGVHFSAGNGYGAWVTYLRNHAKYSADNAWTPGSAYAG